jgi:hypothetical protein
MALLKNMCPRPFLRNLPCRNGAESQLSTYNIPNTQTQTRLSHICSRANSVLATILVRRITMCESSGTECDLFGCLIQVALT